MASIRPVVTAAALALVTACGGSTNNPVSPSRGLTATPPPVSAPIQPVLLVEFPLNPDDGGAFSNYGGQMIADRFTVPRPTVLHSMTWFGRHPEVRPPNDPPFDYPTNEFEVWFFEEAGNRPVREWFRWFSIALIRQATRYDFQGSPWYAFSIPLDGMRLEPGAYWVSIANSSNNGDWIWARSVGSQTAAVRAALSEEWRMDLVLNRPGAFTLFETPPLAIINLRR